MTEYPPRPSHFAHRYCRLLAKACAANDITALGCWLCTVIVHLEDARRYTGPISFYNEQLAPLLGIRKWETLEKARRLAVDHGWLAYESGGRHKPGYYWATIPGGLEDLDDSPRDESRYPKNGDLQGDQGESRYPKNGTSPDTTVEQHGGSFIPIPIPNQNKGASAGESPTQRKARAPKRTFHEPSPEEVRAYCRERGNAIDPQAFVDYYATRGWKLKGGVAMKDWRAAVRTWEHNHRNGQPERAAVTEAEGGYAN